VKTNSQKTIINLFDEHFVDTKQIGLTGSFTELVLGIKNNQPTKDFAQKYYEEAKSFSLAIQLLRQKQLSHASNS
jgi:sulfite reductase (ferredoxin)